ncbi:MAG: hypothetical protein IPH45_03800 [Bacteroidales bacterium]|nr:hypothetical protein [Bacteroidales bacterium]
MEPKEDYKQTLADIRNLMDHSARFQSLSGLAGISSGLAALTGLAAFYLYFGYSLFEPFLFVNYQTVPFLMLDGAVILMVSLILAFILTKRNAQKHNEKLWTPIFKRVLLFWSIPMASGGILLLPYFSGSGPILFPTAISLTLVFYGLALTSASRYSLNELFWLGIINIILGLTAFFLWKYSLIFWGLGFGVMNVVFGVYVYRKHEANLKI